MTESHNEGIYMPGGSISHSTVAAGRNASAVTIIDRAGSALEDAGQEELAGCLRELLEALREGQGQLGEQSQGVHEQAAIAAEELAKPQPSKRAVLRLLHGVAEDSRAVTSIVQAAQSLIDAVQRLL
jgi:hypothetical protein